MLGRGPDPFSKTHSLPQREQAGVVEEGCYICPVEARGWETGGGGAISYLEVQWLGIFSLSPLLQGAPPGDGELCVPKT